MQHLAVFFCFFFLAWSGLIAFLCGLVTFRWRSDCNLFVLIGSPYR